MRLFFSKHELKLRRKRTIAAVVCVVIVLGSYEKSVIYWK